MYEVKRKERSNKDKKKNNIFLRKFKSLLDWDE
jgi:hypothetical protein